MKIIELFPPINTCYDSYLNEAKRRGTQGQRGQPATDNTAGNNASGTGVGRPDAGTTADSSVGQGGTDRDARDSAERQGDNGLAAVAPQPLKCKIEPSPHFDPSIGQMAAILGIDQATLETRIEEFIDFKSANGCSVPFTQYGEDKPSGTNLRGESIRPYLDDHHWHCHLSISAPGDPMIAYRLLDTGIRLVCITTHKLCFAQRADFIRQHADEFTKTMKRRPSLGKPKK